MGCEPVPRGETGVVSFHMLSPRGSRGSTTAFVKQESLCDLFRALAYEIAYNSLLGGWNHGGRAASDGRPLIVDHIEMFQSNGVTRSEDRSGFEHGFEQGHPGDDSRAVLWSNRGFPEMWQNLELGSASHLVFPLLDGFWNITHRVSSRLKQIGASSS